MNVDNKWQGSENLLNEPAPMKKDWFEHCCEWLESDHFTARGFRYFCKGIIVMMAVVACVFLLWFTGNDYFKELRCFSEKDKVGY